MKDLKREMEKSWNRLAMNYEEFSERQDSYSYSIEWPSIEKMIPSIEDKRVLDIGCGTGRFTFLMERYQPSKLIGIDNSEKMLELARKKAREKQSKAQFLLGDLEQTALNEKVDFIFSSTTTHYISDLNQLFRNCYKSLSERGEILFSVMHPIYTAQYPKETSSNEPATEEWSVDYLNKAIREYVQPWDGEKSLSQSYHHTFSDYVNALVEAGFFIERMEESLPPETWREEQPSRYNSYMATPTYLIIKGCKY